MTEREFLACMQTRVARIAVGASTATGRVNTGVVAAARRFLRSLPLREFGISDLGLFQRRLDKYTRRLQASLPKGARHWGLARKALNIFLRDCLYTSFLCKAYSLGRSGRFL